MTPDPINSIDLLLRRDSSNAKCCNCRAWTGLGAIGDCARHKCKVLDLAVCSAWERASDATIEVRRVGQPT